MARVLVPIAAGFEEIETATLVDVLRRAGIEVLLAGLEGGGPLRGSRGMVFVPDVAFDEATGPFDLVALPGGMPNARALAAHEGLRGLLRERVAHGQAVAALCAAPLALDRAGVLTAYGYTCYPGVEEQLETAGRRQELVVRHGPVTTSQGPATAMAFALDLVDQLLGPAARDGVARGLLAP